MIKNIASKIFEEVLPKTITTTRKQKVSKQRQAKKDSTADKMFSSTVFLRRSSSDITTASCSLQPKSSCNCAVNMNKKDSKNKYEDKDEEYILNLLFFAIQYKNTDLIAELCESLRMNLNILNEDGISPLHFAAIVGAPDCIEILREYGACCNMLDVRGQKPIYYANMMESQETVLSLNKNL